MSVSFTRFVKPNNNSYNNNKEIYTVAKYTSSFISSFNTPYMIQIDKNNIIKSSIVGFTNKTHAIHFAHILEQYYQRNYIWPQFNIENNTSNILFYSKYYNKEEQELNTLYIDTWDYNEMVKYCRDNIVDLLLLQEKTDNSDEYNNYYQIMYKVKLYNIESNIKKQKYVCESMYNYTQ